MDPTFLLIVVVGLVAMMFFSSRARKKQIAQMEQLQDSLQPGTWVRTGSGMYGIVDDVDGDVVILRTPDGDESYWDKRAISHVQEPPFASDDSEAEDEQYEDDLADSKLKDEAVLTEEKNEDETPRLDFDEVDEQNQPRSDEEDLPGVQRS